jgi:hypothetical protein
VASLGRPGGLSEAGKKELLERWKAGESISDISRALKKPPGSIHGMLKAQGGIAPPHGRSSRFVMLVRLGGKDTESVVAALGEQIRRLPRTMIDTLTWDRGTEMAAHKSFTVATDVAVYFCDPKSPWQRATSENTNRLIRQYLPTKTDLSLCVRSNRPRPDRAEAQHEAAQDFRLQHPGCYTGRDRCAHRLNQPRPSSPERRS